METTFKTALSEHTVQHDDIIDTPTTTVLVFNDHNKYVRAYYIIYNTTIEFDIKNDPMNNIFKIIVKKSSYTNLK